ncbi:MAG: hypothetical protein AB7F40_04480 [Victivallaceae bacterium]
MIFKSFGDYTSKDYLVVIPSKGRPRRGAIVQNVFPFGVLYVNEREAEYYAKLSDLPIITHRETRGYGAVMNSIFSGCASAGIRYVAIFDDDIEHFDSLVGNRQRRFTSVQTECAIVNACQVLEDLDSHLYLFSTCSSIVKYCQATPFKIGFALSQGAMVCRAEKMGRFRVGMHHYEDFDFCMDYVMKNRFMVVEDRFQAVSGGTYEEGGCNSFRTGDNEKESREYLISKWKGCVSFVRNQSGVIRPHANITFRQV